MEKPQRILLIEDCTRGMSPTFSQFAFARNPALRLNLAANLYDAGNRLRNGGFSLILLNLRLPDCQGIETLRRFQEINGDVAVAVLLQDDEWHLEKDARQRGAVGVFSPGRVPVDEALKLCGKPSLPLGANSVVEAAVTLLPENDATAGLSSPTTASSPPVKINDNLRALADIDVSLTPANAETPVAALPVENSRPLTLLEEISESGDDDDVAIETLADLDDTILIETPPYAVNQAKNFSPAEPAKAPVAELKLVTDDAPQNSTREIRENRAPVAPSISAKSPKTAADAEFPLIASATDLPTAKSPVAEIADADKTRAEIVRLRKEIFHYRAVRQELEGVNRALEERCRELEAGQAALIEAEHVAIEREKSAREIAEQRAEEAVAEREKEIAVYRRRAVEFEEQYQALQQKMAMVIAERDQKKETESLAALAEISAAREKELSAYRQRADLFEKQYRGLELQLAQMTAANAAIAAQQARDHSEPALSAAATAEIAEQLHAQYEELKTRFAKLERTYHETSAEKKNTEKKSETLARVNAELLQRVNELTLLAEQLGATSAST